MGKYLNFLRRFSKCSTLPYEIQPSSEVLEALQEGRPLVALESTILTHGMPYPHNYRMAKSVEVIVREHGATPATIAILDGKICAGLNEDELNQISKNKNAIKITKRDIPYALAKAQTGGTTVSATMAIAYRLGIPVFVTGGIGGVHRGAENSMDISSDLTELGKTPIAVICAGVKSILDIGKTLEYLETQAVGVLSYNVTGDFPAFYSSKSGYLAPHKVNSPAEAAEIIDRCLGFNMQSGILIGVPIPEEHSLDGSAVEQSIQRALEEARKMNVMGKNTTPFLLQRVNELTSGKSLQANIALIENNAKIGSQIAVKLAQIKKRSKPPKTKDGLKLPRERSRPDTATPMDLEKFKSSPVVIGGSNVDFIVQVTQDEVKPDGSTNRGKIRQSYGGVGRNLASALSRMNQNPFFISAVGRDYLGTRLLQDNPELDSCGIAWPTDQSTATYSVVIEKSGELFLGVGDMGIHEHISITHVSNFCKLLQSAPMVIMDGNTPKKTLDYLLDVCAESHTAVWYEPTDANRADKPFKSNRWKTLSYISPNFNELKRIYSALTNREVSSKENNENVVSLDKQLQDCLYYSDPLMEHIPCVIITLGSNGIVVVYKTTNSKIPSCWKISPTNLNHPISAIYYPAPTIDVKSVSGAGDCLAAGIITGILTGQDAEECFLGGLYAAYLSLQSHLTVPEELTYESTFGNGLKRLPTLSCCKPHILL